MALPLTLIVITGEIDLSVASMLGLTGVLMAELFKHGWPIWPAMLAALALGAVLGAFNGFLVTRVGLPSLAVTIGTLTLYRGIAQGILPTDTIGGFPTYLTNIGVVPIPGTHIPYSIAFFAVLARRLRASSCTRRRSAARSSRSAPARRRRSSRASASSGSSSGSSSSPGCCAAFAGILWTLRFASARYDSGIGLELYVVTIVLLGGVSIFGGRGTIARSGPRRGRPRRAADGSDGRPHARAGPEHRRRRPPARERDRPERRRHLPARPRAAAQRGGPQAPRRGGAGGGDRDESASSGSASRRTGRSSRACASGWRAISAASRRGSKRWARRSSPPGSSTRAQAARAGRRDAGRGAARPRAPLHGDVRDVVAGAAHRAGGRRARRDPQSPADADARLRGDDDRRVAGELLGLLRSRDRRRVHAGAHPVPHRHRHAARRRPGLGRRCASGSTRRTRCAACGRHASASSATRIRGCSTCTPTSRRYTRRPARTSRCSRSTTSSSGSSAADAAGDRAQGRGDPRDLRPRRARAPIRSRPRSRPRSSSGRRASRSGSTGWSPTSSWTGSPTTTAALGGNVAERVAAGLIVGNSLLTARGVPAVRRGRPEDERRDAPARPARRRRLATPSSTRSTSTSEFVLMGHDGPGHLAIAEGRPVAARAQALPRQVGRGPVDRDEGAGSGR